MGNINVQISCHSNLSDIDSDVSRSLKVKDFGGIGVRLPLYMISYCCLMVTYKLNRFLYEI